MRLTKERTVATAELADRFPRLDLSPLDNRLAGKPLIELEHCMIEVLGTLYDDQQGFLANVRDLAADCVSAKERAEFMHAYADYTKARADWQKINIGFSPPAVYFRVLRDRLFNLREKQEERSGASTVSHAQQLAAIITNQLEIMAQSAVRANPRVEQCFNHWFDHKRA